MQAPLRVGIQIPDGLPTAGGGFVFQEMIFEEILRRQKHPSREPAIKYVPLALRSHSAINWGLKPNEVLDLFTPFQPPSPPPRRQRAFNKIKRLVKFKAPEIQHQPDLHQLLRDNVDITWSLTHIPPSDQTPFIITVWDLQHRLQPFFPEVSINGEWESREREYCLFTKKATFCVVGTSRGKDELSHFYSIDAERIVVNAFPCPPCLDNNAGSSRLDVQSIAEESYLLYPAQFWPHKNHLTLLHAFAKIIKRYPHLKLVLTGADKGYLSSILASFVQLDLANSVVYLGFVDRRDLAYLYCKALALVYPSFFGPDNIPPLEAISYGIPALVADVPGAREQFGDAVHFFDPFDPESICTSIEDILTHSADTKFKLDAGITLIRDLTPANYVDKVESAMIRHRYALHCASLKKSKLLPQ